MAQLLLDRYRILSEVDEGGYGTVLLAYDERIARRVAIKRIALDLSSYQAAVALQEARIAALLNHPSIVSVLDFETDENDHAYLIMEYVDGITLADLPSEELTDNIIAACLTQVGAALSFAHENGVLHLDIKPGNILINHEGHIKITDFGLSLLSHAGEAGGGRRHGRAYGGTVGYMPLEQLHGEATSEQTDLWAFAAVLYELCTDEYPYYNEIARRPTLEAFQAAQEAGEPPLLEMRAKGLTDIFATALSCNPDERHESVADFVEELEPYFGDSAAGSRELKNLMKDLSEELDEDIHEASKNERARAAREHRQRREEQRLQKRSQRPPRGCLAWFSLLLGLSCVAAAALVLLAFTTPQLFGDKQLYLAAGAGLFFILIGTVWLRIRTTLRKRQIH
jgi:serine/threonine protein kinase